MRRLSILADIGGTNTRVALAEGARVLPETVRRYRNAGFTGIDAVLARYVAEERPGALDGACVAGAGPVRHGVVTMTNLRDADGAPWIIDADRVSAATGVGRVAVLNDLQAQGHALGHLAADHLTTVVDGPVETGATMLVVGLGTGVNAAPVHLTAAGRIVPPSECGHVALAAQDAEMLALIGWLEARLGARGEVPHAGVEEALSGRGLANLQDFAAHQAGNAGAKASSAEVLAGLAAEAPQAIHAARLYTRILAQMLADQALIHLPYGGIYLIGGMSQAMAPHVARFDLAAHFHRPRRVALMGAFRVQVVHDDYAALTGCAVHLNG